MSAMLAKPLSAAGVGAVIDAVIQRPFSYLIFVGRASASLPITAQRRNSIETELPFGLLKTLMAKVLVGLMVGRAVLPQIAA